MTLSYVLIMQTSTGNFMPKLTIATLILTMLFWGGTFISGRMLAESVPPASAAFLRFSIGSLCLLLLLFISEGRLSLPPKEKWLALFLLGLTGVFSYNVFFFSGLRHIGAGRASLIIAATPLVITIFAVLFFREPLSWKRLFGILISFFGAILVISNGNPADLFHGGFGMGEKAILGCVLSWTAYSLIGRSVLSTLSPLVSVCYSSIIGTLLLFIPAVQEGLFDNLTTLTLSDWINLNYLGICGTALGFSLYYRGIQQIGATRAGVFINLVPVFSIILSWILLKESIQLVVLAGGGLVLLGVYLTNRRK